MFVNGLFQSVEKVGFENGQQYHNAIIIWFGFPCTATGRFDWYR